jgi:hypothetical protein
MDNKDDLEKILQERKQLRRQERLARTVHDRKDSRMSGQLERDLLRRLPSALVPGNVGNFFDVAWPFDYTVSFDFGLNPTWDKNTQQIQSFQVTQEAAFIIGAISRKCYSGSTSGELAPLVVQIRDRQSTRQFMDLPIPIQAIAKKTPQTNWEVPFIMLPNAFIDVTVTSFLTQAQSQLTVGNSRLNITFTGYRTRTSDVGQVLSTIFGG